MVKLVLKSEGFRLVDLAWNAPYNIQTYVE